MVSIHRIPIVVYLTIRVISYIFRFKRGDFEEMYHLIRTGTSCTIMPPANRSHPSIESCKPRYKKKRREVWKQTTLHWQRLVGLYLFQYTI